MLKWIRSGFLICLSSCTGPLHAAPMQFYTNEEPPTNYREDGKIVGITVDIVRALQEKMGGHKEILMVPWQRAYETAKNSPNAMLFTAAKTKAREPYFSFIGPVTTRNHILYKKKGGSMKTLANMDALTPNYSVGVLRGDWREKYFADLGKSIVVVNSHEVNVRKLMLDRLNYWATSDLEALLQTKQYGVNMKDIDIGYVFMTKGSYIIISKKTDSAVIAKWQQAYHELLAEGLLDTVAKKWSEKMNVHFTGTLENGLFIQ